ncbi:amino acid ABC transporter ATP-binding/permease protein [Dermabacteraceae bacterium CCM 9520]
MNNRPANTHAATGASANTTGTVAWLLRQARPVLKPLAISAAARIAHIMIGIAMLMYPLWQLGSYAASGSGQPLWLICLVLIVLALAKAGLRYLEQFSGHYVAFKALELLRGYAYTRLYPQSPALTRRARSGDLLARLTRDIDRIEVFYAHTIVPALSAAAVPVLTCAAMWLLGAPLLGLLTLALHAAAIALISLAGYGFARGNAGPTLRARSAITSRVQDIVQGHRDIVGYGIEKPMLEDLDSLNADLLRASRPSRALLALRTMFGTAGMLGLIAATALLGANQYAAGQIGLPVLLACIGGAMRSWESVKGVEDFSTALTASLAAASRLREITDAPPIPAGGSAPVPTGPLALAAEGVGYSYTDGTGARHEVLRDVTVRVPAASWTALVGATGCGKSTLATLWARFEDPESGRITVGGADAATLDVTALREAVAYLPQRAHLFNDTVAGNLRLAAPDATDADLWRVLEIARIADEVRAMPNGLETLVGEGGESVSGGQRQRLALARALLRSPRALVLDEATAHLDDALAEEVRRSLRAALPEATVVEITHRLGQLSGVDHLYVMDSGRIVEHGSVESLTEAGGTFAALLQR